VRPVIRLIGTMAVALLALQACGSANSSGGAAAEESEPLVVLLDAVDETVLGGPIEYPTAGTAQITTGIVTLQPGDATPWHRHDTPQVAYIIDGTVNVDYGEEGTRTFEAGEALVEAIGVRHRGTTVGDIPVRILVVNIGSADTENTVTE